MPSPLPSRPPSPEQVLADAAQRLVQTIDRALPEWVTARLRDAGVVEGAGAVAVAELIAECRDAVTPCLQALLVRDIDEQRSTPLTEVGRAVAPVTRALGAHGVVIASRDPFDVARDPDDVYGIRPRTWSDLGPEVAEAGMTWGAAKAFVHMARHRD